MSEERNSEQRTIVIRVPDWETGNERQCVVPADVVETFVSRLCSAPRLRYVDNPEALEDLCMRFRRDVMERAKPVAPVREEPVALTPRAEARAVLAGARA